ncbi:MAG: hypothetical protein JWQ69_2491, partial [Pseudomonas sp.]|nr:hypothetical protein [Pseudomonas sp.]
MSLKAPGLCGTLTAGSAESKTH